MIEIPKNWADLPEDERFLFYSSKGWILSNFAAARFYFNGKWWATAEHAYQAAKFKRCDDKFDPERQQAYDSIQDAEDPYTAKEAARMYTNFIRPDWGEVKLQIMLDIKRAQVKYVPRLKRAIIEFSKCGQVWLVEDSSKDAFWGRGEDWCGQNMLGIIYMIIYQEYANPRFSELREQLGLK